MACAPFKPFTRAAPPSQVVPWPSQRIRVGVANASVAMYSDSWGVGGPNTRWPEHAGRKPPEPGARDEVIDELDTTVRECIHVLDAKRAKL